MFIPARAKGLSLLILGTLLLLSSCGSDPSLKPSTTSLPSGRVGVPYSAALQVSGGTPPYQWSVTGGSLPAGLVLNGLLGTITGTPTTPADRIPLTFRVTDASHGAQSATLTLSLTVNPGTISVSSVTPSQSGATPGQQLQLSAATNDFSGVTWSSTAGGGQALISQGLSGAILTAPTAPGIYTVTATSITDPSQSATATVAVTDLAGVYTWHNDLARTGANTQEYALTPANVNASSFGKLFSCTVDGAIYAQPLWVANVPVGGTNHNVVFVATQHDSVFAFDADQSPCQQLWSASMLDSAHGAKSGETTVPSAGPGALVGVGSGNITPETGITGTPVIDPSTGTLYVVSKSVDSARANAYQRLHAIDLTTGAEKPGSPVTIVATFPGTGDGGTNVTFNPMAELQRPALAFANGTVYIAWASHEDNPPYYGWLIGYTYDGKSFTQAAVFNVDPNAGLGGIWMSGAAPAVDEEGNLYVLTGNGVFDANNAGPLTNNDYGDSLLKLSSNLTFLQYFTPSGQATMLAQDSDFGSGGVTLISLPAGAPATHLVAGGGKDGALYVLNGDALGGYGDNYAWQQVYLRSGIFSTQAFWNNYLYGSVGYGLQVFQLDPSTAQFAPSSTSPITTTLYGAGPSPSISAYNGSNGIIWILDRNGACALKSSGVWTYGAPAVLEAYDAANLGNELWSSAVSGSDAAGIAVRFAVPTVANGKVYLGTAGTGAASCSLTSTTGELDVYGLK